MTYKHTQLIEDMKAWAVEAGAHIIHFSKKLKMDVQTKDDGSRVTEADLAAENFILGRFAKHYPDLPVIGEEAFGRGDAPSPNGHEAHILIDALDGTKPFLKGKPDVTVNIALVEKGSPTLGVIYAPFFGHLYYTHNGQAFKQDVGGGGDAFPISCRPLPEEGATFIASRDLTAEKGTADTHFPLIKADFITMGSSLKFCYVAEGLADIYVRPGRTCHWDTAAGHAILAAAGGQVLKLDPAKEGLGYVDLTYDPDVSGLYNPDFVALSSATLVYLKRNN